MQQNDYVLRLIGAVKQILRYFNVQDDSKPWFVTTCMHLGEDEYVYIPEELEDALTLLQEEMEGAVEEYNKGVNDDI